jgi:hypothetical protein
MATRPREQIWTAVVEASFPKMEDVLSVTLIAHNHIQYSTIQYSTLRSSPVQYNTMRYSTVRSSPDQCTQVQYYDRTSRCDWLPCHIFRRFCVRCSARRPTNLTEVLRCFRLSFHPDYGIVSWNRLRQFLSSSSVTIIFPLDAVYVMRPAKRR